MHVSRAKQQRQNAGDGFIDAKTQLAQQTERDQRRQHVDQDTGAVTDDDAANGGVIFVFSENMPVRNPCGHQVGRQHE